MKIIGPVLIVTGAALVAVAGFARSNAQREERAAESPREHEQLNVERAGWFSLDGVQHNIRRYPVEGGWIYFDEGNVYSGGTFVPRRAP